MKYDSFEKIIAGAIEKEIEAYELYTQAAKQVTEQSAQKLFEELASEELVHKQKLKNIDISSAISETAIPKSTESRMIDFLVDKPLESIDNIQDIFIFAMKRERLAQEFYQNTAALVTETKIQQLLLALAEEEKTHLNRLETIYDEKIQGDY